MLFLAALLAALLVNLLEMVLYLAFTGWYYRAGPPLARHLWHTHVSQSDAATALQSALDSSKLAWRSRTRDHSTFFAARKHSSRFSMWPRFAFTVLPEPGSDSATITCESRPFVSTLLFLPPLLLAPVYPFMMFINATLFILVAISYTGFWFWERNPKQLDQIRRSLASIGVQVCPHCGYDLRASPTRCPECGATP